MRKGREITDAITFHIVKNIVPINTVTKEGFKNTIWWLDKRYVITSCTYFSQVVIPELYKKYKAQVETQLSQVEYYGATTDL